MKFGKRLKKQMEDTLPEWGDKFLSYKQLKKLLRLVSATPASSVDSKAGAKFISLLDAELGKLNDFFEDREEEFVIRQKILQERIQWMSLVNGDEPKAEYDAEMERIRKDIVSLHGEMVLLVNYSSINYTGLTKILKKYDKRTGTLLRLPFINKVLIQPFYATELISGLVKECESAMDVVFPVEVRQAKERKQGLCLRRRTIIFQSTVAALETMQELRKGSSTYSHFSLPPLKLPENDLPEIDLFENDVPE